MGFDWDSYLRVAEILLDPSLAKNTIMGARRSAVSRAYYGAFHAALTQVNAERIRQGDGPLPEIGSAHGDVMRCLWADGANKDRRRLSQQIDTLRADRREADYRAGSSIADHAEDARDAVENARAIIEKVRQVVR